MWVEAQSSAQYCFHKLNFDNSCQKIRKIKYYIFEVLSFYCIFLLCTKYFVQHYLKIQIFGCNLTESHLYLNFWTFSVTSKHFSNHDENIKHINCVKSSKFNGFVLAIFCILGLGQNLTSENFTFC